MGLRLFVCLLLIAVASAQVFRVCVPATDIVACQNLEMGGSDVSCVSVGTRVDCALKLSNNEADFGAFTDEEALLLSQQQPTLQVIGTIRSTDKTDVPYAFESVAIVPNNHTGGLEGLRNGKYCHPGLDSTEVRWSPRVLKALEVAAARTDRCPGSGTERKTAEELEVETLSSFFSEACRPGRWSFNSTVDADLKSRYPNLCALCDNSNCNNGYSVGGAIIVAGVSNNNRHIQALDCLLSGRSVAYVAWQHVQEFFTLRNPQNVNQYSVLCSNGTLVPLTAELVALRISPCAIVRQPWRTIVANSFGSATTVRNRLLTWFPSGADPGMGWASTLYQNLVGGSGFRILQEEVTNIYNYTNAIRPIDNTTASSSCLASVRWCTVSVPELNKCAWLAAAAHTLGLQPAISCERRADNFACLADIRDRRTDLFSVDSHYGYIARKNFRLSAVKLVQNTRATASRVAAFVKETTAQSNVTRFENLRDKVACFPEYGGLAYVAFLRTAHERQIISSMECDYARAVGEYFSAACAPGATSDTHALTEDSNFNSTVLCTACKSAFTTNQFTCAWDYTNQYFGNNGSINCLADPATDVAFLETQNLAAQMATLNLNPANFRALCRNNTLANNTGVNIDDACLLAHVVDAEVLARRDDPANNALNTLFDALDRYFGYNVAAAQQLINFLLYSPFGGTADLLFKDTTIGLEEYSSGAVNEQARNYVELFSHLEACTGAAPPGVVPPPGAPGFANKIVFSMVTLLMAIFPRLI